jgi:hypothetical protein
VGVGVEVAVGVGVAGPQDASINATPIKQLTNNHTIFSFILSLHLIIFFRSIP